MPSIKKQEVLLDDMINELLNSQTTAPGVYDTITTTASTGIATALDFDSVIPIDPIQGF